MSQKKTPTHARKGSGITLSHTGPNSSLKGSAEEVGIPPGAMGPDKSRLPPIAGPLKKQSRRGKWQKRQFQAVNHYLVYYASSKMINIRCVHDLVLATKISVTGRFGYFELVFFDGGDVLSLKAPTLECAEKWVENLVARQQMFVKHAPTNDHQRLRRGTYLERAVKDVVHAAYVAATPPAVVAFDAMRPEERRQKYTRSFEGLFAQMETEVVAWVVQQQTNGNDGNDGGKLAKDDGQKRRVEKTVAILNQILHDLNKVHDGSLACC